MEPLGLVALARIGLVLVLIGLLGADLEPVDLLGLTRPTPKEPGSIEVSMLSLGTGGFQFGDCIPQIGAGGEAGEHKESMGFCFWCGCLP